VPAFVIMLGGWARYSWREEKASREREKEFLITGKETFKSHPPNGLLLGQNKGGGEGGGVLSERRGGCDRGFGVLGGVVGHQGMKKKKKKTPVGRRIITTPYL